MKAEVLVLVLLAVAVAVAVAAAVAVVAVVAVAVVALRSLPLRTEPCSQWCPPRTRCQQWRWR